MSDIHFTAVLADEFTALHGPPRQPIVTEGDYASAVSGLRPGCVAALCLSGGGIRSASFALGVLQSLARHGLLQQFHYLSTVSGGGYIGSWLQAWRHQAGGLAPVMAGLNWRDPQTGKEPPELTGLRENSAYLTPKLGVTSADSWALLVLVIRNLVLNWAVLGPLFLAVLAIPLFAYDLMTAVALRAPRWVLPVTVLLGSLSLAAGLHSAAWLRRFAPPPAANIRHSRRHLPAWQRLVASLRDRGQPAFLATVLLPVQGAACFISLAAGKGPCVPLWAAALWGAGIYLAAWASAWARARRLPQPPPPAVPASDPVPRWMEFSFWVLCGALAGVLVALGFEAGRGDLRGLVVVGASCFMLAILIPEIVYVGLASYANSGDDDREWLARSAGWLLAAAVAWMALSALVLYAGAIAGEGGTLIALAVGAASGAGTAAGGTSAKTAANFAVAQVPSRLSSKWLLPLGALVFIVALAVVLSVLDAKVLGWLSSRRLDFFGFAARPGRDLVWDIEWILFLADFVFLASLAVNVNRFSLHGVYRNRLIRAFLGSARRRAFGPRPARRPNAFTGFDQKDNPAMAELWSGDRPVVERRLFPIVNMALNVVGGNNLAWQERKAESFTASPLHCGNPRVGFRCTHEYGGMNKGLSLGTAMAISGAAVSPSMGYHSSPLVGFVMMLFNVRLGWWLGNPRANERVARGDGPDFGVGAVIRELFGLTTDDAKYVYLSDGGHFENLGIYEMVRRRCRFILVSDAGQDLNCHFEDLGNAVRKIRIDLGVPIEFKKLVIEARATPARPGVDCAIAVIRYRDARPGLLIYLKPGYHGNESPDVRSYANLHTDFPHENTADQFFTESQMESYRTLGAETLDLICRGHRHRRHEDEDGAQLTFAEFVRRVRAYLHAHPPPRATP